jgi:tetratricopeptide (TPR) repeat protein
MLVLGGVYLGLGLGVIAVFHGMAVVGALSALFGSLMIGLGLRQRRIGPAVMLNNAAHDLLTQGRYDEAMALLDTIPPESRGGLVGMAALSQRAYVLFARGDAAGAVAVSAEALALKAPLFARAQGEQYQLVLRANRALMLAAAGEAAMAREEAARVDASPHVQPLLKGITALARAVTHARAGEREALVGELTRSRSQLDQLSGREAMLVRALARLAAVPAGSAYRAPASREGELSAAARWIVTVVPQAAPFAPRAAERALAVDPGRLPVASAEARARVLADRALGRKLAPDPRKRMVLVVAVTTAVAVSVILSRGAMPPAAGPWLMSAMLVSLVALAVRRNRALDRAIREARSLYADGRVEESDARLDRAAKATTHAHAAIALLDLAEHAERRDDLPAALALCDRGLGRLRKSAAVSASMSDILVPSLIALRARVLAAMGRTDEALAELDVIASEHPTFPFATGASLVVRVLVALRLGDRELARDLARTRATDTRLPRHAELLFDLLLGEAGWFEADGERERIEAELSAHPGVRAWIDRVAPGLTAHRSATTGVRISDLGGTADAEAHGLDAAADAPRGTSREG